MSIFFKVLKQFNVFKVYKIHNNFDLDDAFIVPYLITNIKAHSLKYLLFVLLQNDYELAEVDLFY